MINTNRIYRRRNGDLRNRIEPETTNLHDTEGILASEQIADADALKKSHTIFSRTAATLGCFVSAYINSIDQLPDDTEDLIQLTAQSLIPVVMAWRFNSNFRDGIDEASQETPDKRADIESIEKKQRRKGLGIVAIAGTAGVIISGNGEAAMDLLSENELSPHIYRETMLTVAASFLPPSLMQIVNFFSVKKGAELQADLNTKRYEQL